MMNTQVYSFKLSALLLGLFIFILFVIMATSIFQASVSGSFWPEVTAISKSAWGVVTFIDLYIGLILFSMWVFWRENDLFRGSLWASAIVLLGNLISCLYLLLAIHQTGNNFSLLMQRKLRGPE